MFFVKILLLKGASTVCIYHGQPYARVNLNPMPESTLTSSQGLLDFASELWAGRCDVQHCWPYVLGELQQKYLSMNF